MAALLGMAAALFVASPGIAYSRKIPDEAPVCAPPGTVPVFLSPAGEPFRGTVGQAYPSAIWFARADANGDGSLTRAEMIADASRFFARLDTDHDGRLTPEEVQAYERDVAPETSLFVARDVDFYERSTRGRHQADAMGRSSDYGGAMGAGRYAWLNIPEPVAAADLEFDRVVTTAEFARAASNAFDSLGGAAHERLALSDLPKTPAQMALEGPCRQPKAKRR